MSFSAPRRPLDLAFVVVQSPQVPHPMGDNNSNSSNNYADSDSDETFDDMPPLTDMDTSTSIHANIDADNDANTGGTGTNVVAMTGIPSERDIYEETNLRTEYIVSEVDEDEDEDEYEDEDYFDEDEDDADTAAEVMMAHYLQRVLEDIPEYDTGDVFEDEDYEESHAYDDFDEDLEGSDPCNCPQCVLHRIVGRHSSCYEATDSCSDEGDEHDNDVPLDPLASPCAICMEPETAARRFACLPCCSSGSRMATRQDSHGHHLPGTLPPTTTDTSSTRFCYKCLVTCLVKNGCGVHRTLERGDHDHGSSDKTNGNTDAQLAGECPRCKKLLVLEELPLEDNKDASKPKWQHPLPGGLPKQCLAKPPLARKASEEIAYHKRTVAAIPSTEAMFWYVASRNHLRIYLVVLATCPNPRYIPEELLLTIDPSSTERIRLLCQWGLIAKRQNSPACASTKSRTSLRKRLGSIMQQLWQRGPLGTAAAAAEMPDRSDAFWNKHYQAILGSVRTWRISRACCSLAEASRNLPNRSGTVYQIDPTVQHTLHRLSAMYLQLGDLDDPAIDRVGEEDQREYEGYFGLCLLAPRSKLQTQNTTGGTSMHDENLELFLEENGRRHCLLVARDCFSSAVMAAGRLRICRSLALARWGSSLVLLSWGVLGLPPLVSWPLAVANNGAARWRWYAMDGLNLVVGLLLAKILVQVFWIGIHLAKAVAVCHLAGSWLDLERQRKRSKRQANQDAGTTETHGILEGKRAVGAGILAVYVAWKTYHYCSGEHCASGLGEVVGQ
ncbi:unnamed protein product [Pseudo-nitzschia multistriata]|uniref:Uncharacterized protein n=1 Tax=Pseudo-nitzschia multistriata TaxID=183589 RepID=A0A448ZJV3_9STRA|nr:unnamed protein product [Pseudo-nitzschia multistriata]